MGGVFSGANQAVSAVNDGVTSAADFSRKKVAFAEAFVKDALENQELVDAVKNLVFPETFMRRMIIITLVAIAAMSAYFTMHHTLAESEEERDRVKFAKSVIFGDSGLVNFLFQMVVVVSTFLMLRRALRVMSSSAVIALQTQGMSPQTVQALLTVVQS